MAHHSDELFSTEDWVEIYRTGDEWEVKLIEATLQNQQIRCRPDYDRKSRQTAIFVAPEHQVDALELVSRIGLVITEDQSTTPGSGENAAGRNQTSPELVDDDQELPEALAGAVEEFTVAEREGIGEIIHYIGRGYELRVGPEPHNIVEEDRWEEFTDLSAQRHEFSILLRHEFPDLLSWLKHEKLMAEFIRLVESTYRDVPPPRGQRGRNQNGPQSATQHPDTDSAEAKVPQIAKFSLWLSLVSLLAALIQLPMYACAIFSVVAIGLALLGAYKINTDDSVLKGNPIVLIAIILALLAIVIGWKQSLPSPVEPDARNESAESGTAR
ncbi:MAG: hypothetical protein OXN17_02555 [Candidatus Poribacteria bacterium]|nr:hypothetical protein [Candidatus Poribacteria bacterium]MDE0506228.1 hypothetical protein [Candidatus Poribacteria bacterium]